jgi:hypothetical protein
MPGVEANMRALKWFGLLSLSVAVGCGGESSKDDDDLEPEGGSGNETSAPSDGGDNGEAGEGSGGTTGGKPAGKGGSTSPGTGGNAAGAPPSMGGGTPTAGAGGVPPKPPPPMGGSAGRPPGNPPPPAEGCMPNSQTSSASYCQLGLTCENTDIKSSCSDQGGGNWYCECSSAGFYQQYVVRDPLGMPACEAVANLCASGEIPDFSGPEECSPALTSRAVDYCQLQEQCSRPLDVEDVTISTPTSSRFVSCGSDGLGGLYCSCNNGAQYQLQGINALTACDLMGDVCEDPSISFDGEPVCMPSGQSVGPGYCSSSTQCTQSEEISDGVVAVRQTYRSADCSPLPAGGSRCNCYSDTVSMQFDSESVTADLATCNLASELCGKKDSLELSGPIECSQSSQSAQGGYCNSVLDCTQAGTIGGQNVKLHGYMQTSCNQNGDAWTCSCNSGTQTASMSLERKGTDWEDCTRASEQCLELVDVEIGTSGGGVRPPIPLPGPAF